MPIFFSRSARIIFVFVMSTCLLSIYYLQFLDANKSLGYTDFTIDFMYVGETTLALVCCGFIMPIEIRKPSDFFFFLYGLFILLPYSIFHPISGSISVGDFSIYFFLLAAPLIVIQLIISRAPRIKFPKVIKSSVIIWLALSICVVGLGLAIWYAPSSASFDISSHYERRIEGRSIFTTGSPLAYLNAASVNGFAPILGFYGGYRRDNKLLAFAIICGAGYFYILGLKAPIFYIFLAYLIGRMVNMKMLNKFPTFIYIFLIGSIAIFAIEYVAFEYSLIADYFLRRSFTVPSYIISSYFDFMRSEMNWDLIKGAYADQPITTIIGEWAFGSPLTNANTNAFLYQLGADGIPMYMLTILLVALVFIILDSAYAAKRIPVLLYLGFSYSILIVEQSATAALISSGQGLLIALAALLRPKDNLRNISASV